jgi:hypothetical protein
LEIPEKSKEYKVEEIKKIKEEREQKKYLI